MAAMPFMPHAFHLAGSSEKHTRPAAAAAAAISPAAAAISPTAPANSTHAEPSTSLQNARAVGTSPRAPHDSPRAVANGPHAVPDDSSQAAPRTQPVPNPTSADGSRPSSLQRESTCLRATTKGPVLPANAPADLSLAILPVPEHAQDSLPVSGAPPSRPHMGAESEALADAGVAAGVMVLVPEPAGAGNVELAQTAETSVAEAWLGCRDQTVLDLMPKMIFKAGSFRVSAAYFD